MNKFMKWLQVEILKDGDYNDDAEFMKEFKEGVIGYSDIDDNGEYLEKALSMNIITKQEFKELWTAFIGTDTPEWVG